MSTETEKKDVMDPQLEEEEDDDMPGLVETAEVPAEEIPADEAGDGEGAEAQDQEEAPVRSASNRGEKKARKAILKLGLKPVKGVNRVAIKRTKDITFVIHAPDVFKSPNSDTYVIFGEATPEEGGFGAGNAGQLAQLQSALANQGLGQSLPDLESGAPQQVEEVEEEDDDAPVDETGLDSAEIDTIISQVGCSRAKAVRTLREKGSLIDAIVALQQ